MPLQIWSWTMNKILQEHPMWEAKHMECTDKSNVINITVYNVTMISYFDNWHLHLTFFIWENTTLHFIQSFWGKKMQNSIKNPSGTFISIFIWWQRFMDCSNDKPLFFINVQTCGKINSIKRMPTIALPIAKPRHHLNSFHFYPEWQVDIEWTLL